jgi:hypothetical protein
MFRIRLDSEIALASLSIPSAERWERRQGNPSRLQGSIGSFAAGAELKFGLCIKPFLSSFVKIRAHYLNIVFNTQEIFATIFYVLDLLRL